MWYALVNGGPAAYLFNLILVLSGALAQAAVFGELASILPIAGAQYYWTFAFAPPKYRMFLTWMQGWATWLGYIAVLAGSFNANALCFEGSILVNHPNYANGGYRTCLFVLAQCVFATVVNTWFFRAVPWLELVSAILNVVLYITVLAVLWIMSPRNPVSSLVTTAKFSGWENDFVSWNVGLLCQIWMFIGFEGISHMGEETKVARRNVPFTMFWSILSSGLMGLVMVITLIVSTGSFLLFSLAPLLSC